jgi:hypothetical protein
LIDVIAGDIGFFAPIVAPHAHGRPPFGTIETMRQQPCPDASRQATDIGFVKMWPRPASYSRRGSEREKMVRTAPANV